MTFGDSGTRGRSETQFFPAGRSAKVDGENQQVWPFGNNTGRRRVKTGRQFPSGQLGSVLRGQCEIDVARHHGKGKFIPV